MTRGPAQPDRAVRWTDRSKSCPEPLRGAGRGRRGGRAPASDRRHIAALIHEAARAGARLTAACATLGMSPRTLQRRKNPEGGLREDRRPWADRPTPANKLSEEERDRIVVTCASPEFASLPPSQIVPRLADRDICIGSESSICRVLHERGQNHRRGRARPAARCNPPASFEAKAPCQVWSWE